MRAKSRTVTPGGRKPQLHDESLYGRSQRVDNLVELNGIESSVAAFGVERTASNTPERGALPPGPPDVGRRFDRTVADKTAQRNAMVELNGIEPSTS